MPCTVWPFFGVRDGDVHDLLYLISYMYIYIHIYVYIYMACPAGPPAQNLKSGFELCTGSNLRQRKSQRIGHGHYGHHAAADFCSNGEGTPMWA